MDANLKQFLLGNSFPCIMARSAVKKGVVDFHSLGTNEDPFEVLKFFASFVSSFRESQSRLSSLMLSFPAMPFREFERFFWRFLVDLRNADSEDPDPRVSNDPASPRFSLSIAGEAFFVLLCHPESPRVARRTPFPLMVFNPHQQFEDLRLRRAYQRIRNIIRKRDFVLQGTPNPMLDDFGHSSEIFQYTGKTYRDGPDEFMKEFYEHHSTQNRDWFPSPERAAPQGDRPRG